MKETGSRPASLRVCVVADESEALRPLISGLDRKGFTCSVAPCGEDALEWIMARGLDLVFVSLNGLMVGSATWGLPRKIKRERPLPVIALISKGALAKLDSVANLDDFVVEPWDASEVAARATRALQRANGAGSDGLIKRGDLVIDPGKCEVTVGGRTVMLTFKEYELLKFLAGNKGRVFSREALLNEVWGYDYYGGDRTVDVHIRRLRSKLEDSIHIFIETVRNVGYRFSDNLQCQPAPPSGS